MLKCYLRIILCNFFNYFSPKTWWIKHICLVHRSHFLISLHSNFKSLYSNTSDFIFIIWKSINCCHNAVNLVGFSFTKIQTACKFTHNQHIKPFSTDLFFKRTSPWKLRIKHSRTKVCKKSKLFSNFKQSCFRTKLRRKLIPWWSCSVSADGTHENSISSFTSFNRFISQRNTVSIDRATSHKKLVIFKFMSKFFCNFIKNLYCFRNNFRTYSITFYYCYFFIHFKHFFHSIYFLILYHNKPLKSSTQKAYP